MTKDKVFKTFLAFYVSFLIVGFLVLVKDVFVQKASVASQIQTLNTSALTNAANSLESRDYETQPLIISTDLNTFTYGDEDPFR